MKKIQIEIEDETYKLMLEYAKTTKTEINKQVQQALAPYLSFFKHNKGVY